MSRYGRLHEDGAVSGASCPGSSTMEWNDNERLLKSLVKGIEKLRTPPAQHQADNIRRLLRKRTENRIACNTQYARLHILTDSAQHDD